ncbi:MAG: Nif3-like dinuclear metal center hexameric protein [Sphaerochaetaceae bacterium]|nr:Nif3-like dinuclear metal center hexameric protein [Sphaerochaetaceae bacterium]
MTTKELTNFLMEELKVHDFDNVDVSLNGIQVDNNNCEVKKVAFAVDGCMATIEKAIEEKAQLLFVHHGLFWGRPLAIEGAHYKRVKTLLDNDLALFACHLPLDCHEEYGHSLCMAKELGLKDIEPFFLYKGKYAGVKGILEKGLKNDEICEKLNINYKVGYETKKIISGGKDINYTVGIVSGDGSHDYDVAIKEGLDAYITGEGSQNCFYEAMEKGLNVLCLGHYETETFGLKAVMKKVEEKGLSTVFIDIPTCF